MNAIDRWSVRGGPAVEMLLEAACQAFQLRNVGVLRGKSRVRAVSGQPIEAASSSSGRGCPAPPVSDGSVGTAAEAGSAG